jgi:hypothetical protein
MDGAVRCSPLLDEAARQILRRAIEGSEWRLDLIEHAVSLANDGHAVALGSSADEAGDGLLFPPSAQKQPAVPGPLRKFKPTPYPRSPVVDVRRQMSYD